ncbi:NRF domain-containing protein, partial [Nephila pilipes]
MFVFYIVLFFLAGTTKTNAETWKSPPMPENQTQVLQSWKQLDKSIKDGLQSLIKTAMPVVLEYSSQLNLSSQCIKEGLQLVSGLRGLKRWAFS